MTRRLLSAATVCLVLTVAASAQYHDPVYIFGGRMYGSSSGSVPARDWYGLFLGDRMNGRVTTLLPRTMRSGNVFRAIMDANNRDVLFAVVGNGDTGLHLTGGLYRLDVATRRITTVVLTSYANPAPIKRLVYNLIINQDGDYIVSGEGLCRYGSSTTLGSAVWKVSAVTGVVSTILNGRAFLSHFQCHYGLGRNIDSGGYLVWGFAHAGGLADPVLDVNNDGTYGTWHNGGGWNCWGPLEQVHATGEIRDMNGTDIMQLTSGTTRATTLARHGVPGPWLCRVGPTNSCLDLQSAPKPRWIQNAYVRASSGTQYWAKPGVMYTDNFAPWATTAFLFDSNFGPWAPSGTDRDLYAFTIWPYRGRHLQTVLTAPRAWDVHISVPQHPGQAYAIALGASGVRPGVRLSDGRRIHLVPDPLVRATLANALPGVWNPGPGVLDARGEARAHLDVGRILGLPKKLGVPLWIAVAIVDPKAPLGIAYLPDTYVIRVP